MQDLILRSMVLAGVATAVLTELLGGFHLLRRGPVTAAWLFVFLGAAAYLWSRRIFPRPVVRLPEAAVVSAIVGIAIVVGLVAWLSPPNSFDAMAYHMPRVLYWAQAGSVAFFPTSYLNQISMPPLAEYLMLQTYLFFGDDRFVNMVAFAAFLGSIVGVSAIANALGLNRWAQALAALFCATLPSGILQASGAKNDWVLPLWLVTAVYFAARRNPLFLGLSVGLALATKGTAYLFAPPLLAGIWLWNWLEKRPIPWRPAAAFLAAGILLISAPQYVRNLRFSGSPLGYDSAHGDGLFRWRNEHPGWKSTVSNALRNLSGQAGMGNARWNEAVYNAVIRIHERLHIDPQDPDTTWRWSRYEAPVQARNHEANASNPWHLVLLGIAALWAGGSRARGWSVYAAALFTAFLLFCFYLKWQPFGARLELPLFVLGAPLAAFLLSRSHMVLALAVCVFLVNSARPALFENWTRPLKGPRSLFVTTRDSNYFSDMGQLNNRDSYLEAVDRTARAGCDRVGVDISQNPLEYPFEALLRERNSMVRFEHTRVRNGPRPCAILCLDCAGMADKIAEYRSFGQPVTIGRFLLFLPNP